MSSDAYTLRKLGEHSSQRYITLIRQLRDERGGLHGWRVQVAEILDVSASYITKVINGSHTSIGLTAIRKAQQALGLHDDFFTLESVGHYTTHVSQDSDPKSSLGSLVDAIAALGPHERRGLFELTRALYPGEWPS